MAGHSLHRFLQDESVVPVVNSRNFAHREGIGKYRSVTSASADDTMLALRHVHGILQRYGSLNTS